MAVVFAEIIVLALLLYVAARLVLLVQAFTTLRSLPSEAFQTVHWTIFVPHFLVHSCAYAFLPIFTTSACALQMSSTIHLVGMYPFVRGLDTVREGRTKFRSDMWTRPSVMESKLGTADDTKQPVVTGNVQDTSSFEDHAQGDAQSGTSNDHLPQPLCLRQVGKGSEPIMPTDVQEVWFAGCHCGVCPFPSLSLWRQLISHKCPFLRRRWWVCQQR